MDEFDLIKKYFAPLAAGFPGSLGLTDDAALIDVPAGRELVITKDAVVSGVHFLGSEDASLVAQKLLRVNLSDLAAMGAKPLAYFLALMLPKDTNEKWLARFTEGLKADQQQFSIHLAGGDTTATNGPASFSVTALGTVEKGKALRRSGAKQGDLVFVSGTLGDGALGLMSLQKKLGQTLVEQRYFLPDPRLVLGQQLSGIASSCIDISDGLVQDMGHICDTSGVSATLEQSAIPLSDTARAMIGKDASLWDAVLSGGDDYELLFTVPPDKESRVPQGCSKIGTVKSGSGVTVLDANKKPLTLSRQGFRHFS